MASAWQQMGYTASSATTVLPDYMGIDRQTEHMKELAAMVQSKPGKRNYTTKDYTVYVYYPARDTFRGPTYEFSSEMLHRFNVPISRSDKRKIKGKFSDIAKDTKRADWNSQADLTQRLSDASVLTGKPIVMHMTKP